MGTLLAAKARAQEEAEGPLPAGLGQDSEKDEAGSTDSEESIEEPTEALLESDSDRDENEHSHKLIVESLGWNVSELYFINFKRDKRTNTVSSLSFFKEKLLVVLLSTL